MSKIMMRPSNPRENKIYEHTLKQCLLIFQLTKKELFRRHFSSTEARRSIYYCLHSYTRLSYADIAGLFGKHGSWIGREINKLKKQKSDPYFEDFINKHNALEREVKEYIEIIDK